MVVEKEFDSDWVSKLTSRFDAILFDCGNTLVAQSNPGTPVDELIAQPLNGVLSALEQFKDKFLLGIVSNTTSINEETLRSLLSPVGLSELFQVVIATAEFGVHKPHPGPLIEAASRLGVDAARCLYVGDSEIDSIAATAAGMSFCYAGPDLEWCLVRFSALIGNQYEISCVTQRENQRNFAVQCQETFDSLAKPPSSLGRLETVLCQIAAVQRVSPPLIDPVGGAVFVADHGVAEGNAVTPWPWTISRDIARLMAEGKATGAVFASSSDVYLEVIDVGLATGPTPAGVRNERVRSGTSDLRFGAAMDSADMHAALNVGAEAAARLIGGGSRLLCVGEVGIGNTTSAAALISWCTGLDPLTATGRGSGIPDDTLVSKQKVVVDAVNALGDVTDGYRALQQIGGLEIAAMTGFLIAAASLGVPVVLDGVITLAAACIGENLVPGLSQSLIASHHSTEPATKAALTYLGLEPLVDLSMRLGEGTGSFLVVPMLRSVCLSLTNVARLTDL